MERTAALDLFQFYSSELKDVQTMYFIFVFIISAGLLSLTVWFLTSEKPHRIVGRIKYARNIFLGSLVIAALLEGRVILLLSNTAGKIQSAISTVVPQMDAHLKTSFYTYRSLSLETTLLFFCFHVLLYSVLAYLIVRSKTITALTTQTVSIKKRVKRSMAA